MKLIEFTSVTYRLMDRARNHARFVAFCALARFGIGLGTIFYSTALFSIIGVMFREKVASVRVSPNFDEH